MKLGSILLGTAAGIVAISSARAADLPTDVPAAVDYVKVCDTFGAGFFYIPGTETCLDISGRVRFTMRYDNERYYVERTGTNGTVIDWVDTYEMTADARVDFDARTMTEYGQLRSFFRLATTPGRGIVADAAYIQLGYLSVGYMGSLWNDTMLYGIEDATFGMGDATAVQVVVDDLGGGFFVGAAIEGYTEVLRSRFNVDSNNDVPDLVLKAGIADQPWGSVDVSFIYSDHIVLWEAREQELGDRAFGAVKLSGEFDLTEEFQIRASATWASDDPEGGDDLIILGLAGAYDVSPDATIYAGLRYDIEGDSDDIYANVGVDYTIVDGLIATGELAYQDVNSHDSFSAIGRLTRNW